MAHYYAILHFENVTESSMGYHGLFCLGEYDSSEDGEVDALEKGADVCLALKANGYSIVTDVADILRTFEDEKKLVNGRKENRDYKTRRI